MGFPDNDMNILYDTEEWLKWESEKDMKKWKSCEPKISSYTDTTLTTQTNKKNQRNSHKYQ